MKGNPPAWLEEVLRVRSRICAQALVVTGGANSAVALAMERRGRTWSEGFAPIPAVIGRAGFAAPGEKREGDGKTPSGVFPLEHAFGYADRIDSAMPYRRIEADDVWVDDPSSSDYNTWVKKGHTSALSFEEMRREDGLYKVGIVVGYNRDPVVKGLGSAIFLHLWREKGAATSGCVAMAEHDLRRILSWLRPTNEPMVILGALAGSPA